MSPSLRDGIFQPNLRIELSQDGLRNADAVPASAYAKERGVNSLRIGLTLN